MKRVVAIVSASLGLVALSTPGAAAAPGDTVPVECDNGESYVLTVNGNGEYTPGRDTGSTSVLVPIRFGNFVFRATLPDGTVIEDSEPGSEYKGHGAVSEHNPRDTVTCTFSETDTVTEDNPVEDFPIGTVLFFQGEVTGYLTGH